MSRCAAICSHCKEGFRKMRADLNTATCPYCGGLVIRIPEGDSRNSRGEATYAVPTDRFPPLPLPKL